MGHSDPHILLSVGEVVQDPCSEVVVHPCVLVSKKHGLYGIERTGEIKEHDSHSSLSLF